jgi:hypothetical protein
VIAHRGIARHLGLVATVVAAAVACSSAHPVSRPTSAAQIRIVSPQPDQTTGPNLTVTVSVMGGIIVPITQVSGALRGDQGHVHLYVDNKLVSMAYKSTVELNALSPGIHTLRAEYVAVDHYPFRNRVYTAVVFQVR